MIITGERRRANLLVRAVDGILGTHTHCCRCRATGRDRPGRPSLARRAETDPRQNAEVKPARHKDTDPLAPVYDELYSDAARADLASLSTEQKATLLARLFDSLVPSPTASGDLAAPAAPEDNDSEAADEEQQSLVSERIIRNCEEGWAAVRRPGACSIRSVPRRPMGRARASQEVL